MLDRSKVLIFFSFPSCTGSGSRAGKIDLKILLLQEGSQLGSGYEAAWRRIPKDGSGFEPGAA